MCGIRCTTIANSLNHVGMKHDLAAGGHELTPTEAQFLTRLRQHPEMLARVQSILDLAHAADGPLKSADAVEERLLQELRQLGHSTLNQWATQAEVRVGDELQRQDSTVRSRKKRR